MGPTGDLQKLTVKYPVFRAKSAKQAVQLYSTILGLSNTQSTEIFGEQVVKESEVGGGGFVVVDDNQFSYSFFLTPNCIQDTLRFKSTGLTCIENPVSTSLGLASKFQDELGNVIILLEEREDN